MTTNQKFIRKVDIPVNVEEIDDMTNIECGFRMEIFSGTATQEDGEVIDVSCHSGTGCGNTWVTFKVGNRRFRIDMSSVAQEIVRFVNEG